MNLPAINSFQQFQSKGFTSLRWWTNWFTVITLPWRQNLLLCSWIKYRGLLSLFGACKIKWNRFMNRTFTSRQIFLYYILYCARRRSVCWPYWINPWFFSLSLLRGVERDTKRKMCRNFPSRFHDSISSAYIYGENNVVVLLLMMIASLMHSN